MEPEHRTRYDWCNPNVHHEGVYPPKINRKIMGIPDNKPELGEICYNAYCCTIGVEAIKWDDLSPIIQEAWQLAAKAVVTYTSQ